MLGALLAGVSMSAQEAPARGGRLTVGGYGEVAQTTLLGLVGLVLPAEKSERLRNVNLSVLVTYYGVNLILGGVHSYA